MITLKEMQEGLNHFKGDEHRAWHAFCHFNMIRDQFKNFDSSTKVATMDFFYNCVFKCKEIDSYFVTTGVTDLARKPRGGYGEHTKDHPYTSRVAGHAILEDNQWMLDDWSIFCLEFFKLPLVVGVLPTENSEVKVTSDEHGGIIIKDITENRYKKKNGSSYLWEYNDGKTSYPVTRFPLKRIDWYHDYEEKMYKQWKDADCNLDTYKKNLQVNDYGQTCI
tara:strand:+ start:745 stop:1407 length:663 start_codon:yes stop_codon:yes gene_type:complete